MYILVHFYDIYICVLSCTSSQYLVYHYWNRLEWLLAEAFIFPEAYSENKTTSEEPFQEAIKLCQACQRSDIFVWFLCLSSYFFWQDLDLASSLTFTIL